ncbi:hypothetical protein CDD83_6208 [Cordyceps sp. RAO-2017]|nr:hypothetical protein CDD83_6208 [Cordyceps sp. RAO-2017]
MSDFGGEDRSLLGAAAAEPRPGQRHEQHRPGTIRGRFARVSKWTFLGFLALLTVLSLPLLAYTRRERLHVVAAPDQKQMAFALHPEQHATRQTTTLTFNWTVTLEMRAPDGVEKQVYLVNGQFPGPVIEARSGDRVVVNLFNGLDSEGVAIHWHGLRMKGHNNMDGAVGFTQCPIPPGRSFIYDFAIGEDEHGTFWWHGHSQAQRGDGLYGGLVVHPPTADLASGPQALLMIGDWFHRKQSDVLDWYADYGSLGNEPVPDSLLLNGCGRFNCSLAVPARPVVCRQLHLEDLDTVFASRSEASIRLRLVNVGTVAGFSLVVEGASVQPVSVDGGWGVNARPGRSMGILYPGERVDVLLQWETGEARNSRLNIYLDDENLLGYPNEALNPNQSFQALPVNGREVVVEQDLPSLPSSDHIDLHTVTSPSAPSKALLPKAEHTILLYLKTQKLSRFENRPLGFVNHTSWRVQMPPLLSLNRSSWDSHQLLPFIGRASEAQVVDLVINNLDDGSHPIHLHGNSFYVLSSHRAEGRDGWGSYNPFESEPPSALNLENPVVKDTIAVPRRGHVVLRFTAANPGLWMLHCHMIVHMGTGMVAGLHVGGADDFEHVDGMDTSAKSLCEENGSNLPPTQS